MLSESNFTEFPMVKSTKIRSPEQILRQLLKIFLFLKTQLSRMQYELLRSELRLYLLIC